MELYGAAANAVEMLKAAGFGAWVVGGYVRDRLMGIPAHDADMCTSARPDQTASVFSGYRVIDTGIRHGTVTVILDGESLEITTLRAETGYADHRRPDSVVFITDIKEDLRRRDFTVNAMATDGREIIDLFGGREDIERRLIRCVGTPSHRFTEDALRILRALRFAAKLDFTIDPETADAAFLLKDTLGSVSAERIQAELSALLISPAAGRIVRDYGEILEAAAPCGAFIPEAAQRIDKSPNDLVLRLAALLYDSPAPDDMLRRLRFSNEVRENVLSAVAAAHAAMPNTLQDARIFLAEFGEKTTRNAFILRTAAGCPAPQSQKLCGEVIERGDCINIRQLAVNGLDINALGITGAKTGRLLRKALDAVMEGTVANNRAALLDFIEREIENA